MLNDNVLAACPTLLPQYHDQHPVKELEKQWQDCDLVEQKRTSGMLRSITMWLAKIYCLVKYWRCYLFFTPLTFVWRNCTQYQFCPCTNWPLCTITCWLKQNYVYAVLMYIRMNYDINTFISTLNSNTYDYLIYLQEL